MLSLYKLVEVIIVYKNFKRVPLEILVLVL
jgi:hypothetical protein